MSLLLTIVTVSAFDHERLKITLESTRNLPINVEHVFIIPENDEIALNILKTTSLPVGQIKISFDDNSGVYNAMNIGATIASGTYVVFWNSGDLLYSISELDTFLCELEAREPIWAVAQGILETGVSQKNSLADVRNFKDQKAGTYISHQVVVCQRKTLFDLGLFHTKYLVAADTKMIKTLTQLSNPMVSDSLIVYIQNSRYASKFQRRSRYETAKLACLDLIFQGNYKPIINVCKREFRFIINLFD